MKLVLIALVFLLTACGSLPNIPGLEPTAPDPNTTEIKLSKGKADGMIEALFGEGEFCKLKIPKDVVLTEEQLQAYLEYCNQ